MSDPYEELGVPKDATDEEIKRAYRRRARETHPDKNDGKGTEEFKKVNAAYQLLSDRTRRAAYDEHGEDPDPLHRDKNAVFLQKIASLILQIIDAHEADLDVFDIVADAQGSLWRSIEQLAEARGHAQKAIALRERARMRLQKKSGGENLLAEFIAGDIRCYREAIEKATAEIADYEKMIELLRDYRYIRDVVTPLSPFFDLGVRIVR